MRHITLEDDDYPLNFKALKNPPSFLWVRGDLTFLNEPKVAIVGTRQASETGKRTAFEFAKKLKEQGIWVISGLARGIDTAAHSGAIGKTLAIIGSGLDQIYPAENKSLADKISVMSEFSPDTPPHRWNFPKRNRLVAALADVVLVIEAPEKSGALITVEEARKLQKKCLSIPGPIEKENFRGSNRLIKEGKAELCLGVEEILAFFKKSRPAITPISIKTVYTNPEELNILSHLAREDLSFDQLNLLTGLSTSVLNINLMSLVLQRAIIEYPGRIYGKIVNHS